MLPERCGDRILGGEGRWIVWFDLDLKFNLSRLRTLLLRRLATLHPRLSEETEKKVLEESEARIFLSSPSTPVEFAATLLQLRVEFISFAVFIPTARPNCQQLQVW